MTCGQSFASKATDRGVAERCNPRALRDRANLWCDRLAEDAKPLNRFLSIPVRVGSASEGMMKVTSATGRIGLWTILVVVACMARAHAESAATFYSGKTI